MTEAEWLRSTDAPALFHHLRWWVRSPERKFRLFACAVCRRCWSFISDLGRHAVGLAEAETEGAAITGRPEVEYNLLNEHNALRVRRVPTKHPSPEEQASLIADAVIASGDGVEAADDALRNIPDEAIPVAALLRDIFGNPFRPVAFLPEWRTSTVLALAQQMYESRDFSAMPILGDALEDAGCADEAILTRCRGRGRMCGVFLRRRDPEEGVVIGGDPILHRSARHVWGPLIRRW